MKSRVRPRVSTPKPSTLVRTQQCREMTNLLDIIHRLFLVKTHDVSETGVCLRHQVKYT
jgi:hypothetical protein